MFLVKKSGGTVTRRIIEPLLLGGSKGYEDAQDRMKELLTNNLLTRVKNDNFTFKLTEAGDLRITPYFNSVGSLMTLVKPRIEEVVKFKDEIIVKGGTSGIYFTYTKLSIFRFHPYHLKGEAILHVRLPNLIDDSLNFKSNEIYLSKEVLEKTSLLEDLIKAHIKMIDQLYAE